MLTPCITSRAAWDPFKVIKERKAPLPEGYDPTDKIAAMTTSEDPEKIYLGVYYQRSTAPTFGDLMDRVAARATSSDVLPVEKILDDFVE